MILLKILIFVTAALVTCCSSEEVVTSQSSERQTDKSILEILTALDEKINSIHAKVVTNEFFPTCIAALKEQLWRSVNKCWQEMLTEVKSVDQSTATEKRILKKFIKDFYNGIPNRLPLITTFIENNVERGSELAIESYKALLHAMDSFGQLYYQKITSEEDIESVSTDYTYRTLIQIKDSVKDASQIFSQTLPPVVSNILSGKELFIQNNMTRGYMYAASDSGDSDTKILVDSVKGNSSRYLWTLWPTNDRSSSNSFFIANSFDHKVLAMADEDGSMKLTDEYRSTSVFRIVLVHESKGEEVIIQMKYKSLCLVENEAGTVPNMCSRTFTSEPTGFWLFQPKD